MGEVFRELWEAVKVDSEAHCAIVVMVGMILIGAMLCAILYL